jgi:hypothetical protein
MSNDFFLVSFLAPMFEILVLLNSNGLSFAAFFFTALTFFLLPILFSGGFLPLKVFTVEAVELMKFV